MSKTRFVGIAAGVVLYISAFLLAQPATPPAADLQREIETLRKQVASLEQRLSRLERYGVTQQAPVPALPLPPGSRESDANGIRFYVVPVR